jgi:hypothetical protein
LASKVRRDLVPGMRMPEPCIQTFQAGVMIGCCFR